MLTSTYTLGLKKKEDDFDLDLPIDPNWKSFGNRMLVICETVDGKDLKAGKLLSERSRTVVTNTLNFARKSARNINKGPMDPFAFAVINFNNAKTFHLKTDIEVSPYIYRFTK